MGLLIDILMGCALYMENKMAEIIKVMLASGITDYNKLRFPKLASKKLDGIRVVIHNGVVYSRSGKPIRSKAVQKLFGHGFLNGLDGEIIYGSPKAHNVFNVTTSAVMSENLPEGMDEDGLHLYVFDFLNDTLPFTERNTLAGKVVVDARYHHIPCSLITQNLVNNMEELLAYEQRALEEGYEGVMLRSLTGKYKHGRATESSQDLLKVKRFTDDEATVVGFEKLMHNANEAKTNELGRTERSSHKENLVGMDTLGALCCVTKEGVPFKIGTGFDAETRKQIWEDRDNLLGKLVKYKHFEIGRKEAPRLPVFLGWRDKEDV